jgi:hypothetical protein
VQGLNNLSLPFVVFILHLLEALISLTSYLTSLLIYESRVFPIPILLRHGLKEVSSALPAAKMQNLENPDSRPRIIKQMIDQMGLKRILFGGAGFGVWGGAERGSSDSVRGSWDEMGFMLI